MTNLSVEEHQWKCTGSSQSKQWTRGMV